MDVNLGLCILVLLSLLALLYKHITRNFDYWKTKNIPYLSPVPIFGNIFNVIMLKLSLGQFVQQVYEYAPGSGLTGFFVFDQPFLLIRDPEILKSILVRDFEYFENRTVFENRRDDEIGANLLFVIRNPAWKSVRSKLTPIFTTGKLKSMLPLMLEACEDLKNFMLESVLCNGELIESREMCMKYTTDVISSCAFGINSKSFKHNDAGFRAAARGFFTYTFSRSIQMSSYFVAPWLVKLFRMSFMDAKASQFMCSVFWKHMHEREISKVKRGDFIDILLQMRENDDDALDGEVLVAQALQFFLAGFETTGGTLAFVLYELALNMDIQNRVREEITETLSKYGEESYEAILDMKYLDNVLSETVRKYPAVTFLDRRCNKPYVIPNSNITIDKGIPIYISLLGLHMDPQYFPNPEKFDPDRFSKENKESIPPFTYLPFGDGPRNCVGLRFGLLSLKTALIAIITNFEVNLHDSTPTPITFDPRTGFLIMPKDGVTNLCFKKLA